MTKPNLYIYLVVLIKYQGLLFQNNTYIQNWVQILLSLSKCFVVWTTQKQTNAILIGSTLDRYTYMLRKWFASKGKKTFITNSKSLQRAYMLMTLSFVLDKREIYLFDAVLIRENGKHLVWYYAYVRMH